MFKLADVKPDADVAYLSAAVIRDALVTKFKELFGREPVAQEKDSPLAVKDTKVPEIILGGVDHDIIPLLKASAVQHSVIAEDTLPDISGCTLLYVIHDDTPAKIALAAVPEYSEMADDARDAVIQDAANTGNLNIEEGVAYLSTELSTIIIGIYVDNSALAQEFQYRLENAGGLELDTAAKLKVFDELYSDLPGGESNKEQTVRSELLTVVGLGETLPAEQRPVAQDMQAPGPGTKAPEMAV
jgi:hypothetical protein